jgi:hypothetical protein
LRPWRGGWSAASAYRIDEAHLARAGFGQAGREAGDRQRMEASDGAASGLANNIAAVRRALEAAGVEFIAENGGGAGVRLRNAVARPTDFI